MKSRHIIGASLASFALLAATVVSAQVVSAPNGAVNVTTAPSTTGITPGSNGTTFGTINVSGNGGGTFSISSIPVTVTPGSGASTANLSNCQIFNSNGSSLTSNGNVINSVNSIGAGTNTFTFDTPLQVTGATTTLSVRCNVSNTATAGTTFQFVAGTPVFAPSLSTMVTSPVSVAAGSQGAALALITLDATRSGQNANVSSVPVTLTFNGASASEFSNCSLRNVNNLGTPLNTGANAVGALNSNGTATSIVLDAPTSVPAGSAVLLALTCNVSPVTPPGSSVTVSVDPANISSTNAATGGIITPTTDSTGNGGTAPVIGTVEITAPGTSTVTPGVPNTGAGGNAPMNFAILAISAAAIILGTSVLVLRRR
jgi:hypothetical protein